MSWMDWGDVRKQRGMSAKDMPTYIDGNQAAMDAARGVRSDKPRKKKKVKGLGETTHNLSRQDERKLEDIAKRRERKQPLTKSDEQFLRSKGFPIPRKK